MTSEEAEIFGVPSKDRKWFVRSDPAKVNILPPSDEATWMKLVSVRLDNGNETYPAGDNVQTVEPWSPPKTWDVHIDLLNAALDDIAKGMEGGQRYSSAPNAGPSAAWPVVQRHCPDRTEKQCRKIIQTWVKTGVLYNKAYHDKVERKTACIGLYVDPTKRPGK
jgi:hypothetical protein